MPTPPNFNHYGLGEVARPAGAVLDVLRLTGIVRRTVVAAVVGVTAGVVTLVAPGWLAAMVSGLTGATTAAAVRLAVALRTLLTHPA